MSHNQKDVRIPHWSVPFRLGSINGAAFVNEQDTDEDIIDCFKVILAYPVGSNIADPDFGRPDLIFRETNDTAVAQLQHALLAWEPRADLRNIEEHVPGLDELVRTFHVQAKGREDG